jgi:hypothetical protein
MLLGVSHGEERGEDVSVLGARGREPEFGGSPLDGKRSGAQRGGGGHMRFGGAVATAAAAAAAAAA